MSTEVGPAGVTSVRAAVLAGDTTATEQVRACAVATRRGTALQAFTQVDVAAALSAAAASDRCQQPESLPLHGVVLGVKDNIDTAGFATTAGTPGLRRHRPQRDARAVAALRAAGALVIGKCNMHELAYGATSDNAAYGRVRNPLRPERIAGGSSGGCAAAVAAGMTTAAIGTETGCSVRVPAALCGLVGFRPTTGAYPGDGVVPVSWTRDTIGVLARSVADVQVLDRVLGKRPPAFGDGRAADVRGMRLAAPRLPFLLGMTAALRTAFDTRLARLDAAGAQIIEAPLPAGTDEHVAACGMTITLYETPPGVERYLSAAGLPSSFDGVAAQVAGRDVRAILDPLRTRRVRYDAYQQALDRRAALGHALSDYFRTHQVDALVVPTTTMTAPRLLPGDRIDHNGRIQPAFPALVRNCDISSVLGWPAITLPSLRDETGLPLGIDLQAPPGTEARLLAVARACEREWLLPGHRR
ncbi:amidase family protein [Streptomyces sp. TRM 70351]|uniref:amidase family protein n=1 Tax=Streptomyces sp. TRM 70351 TaxID=3116552 RepID=UPI002E7C2887|nr:amidase family protein [Streptomyces sp. TRM 70351]MEE1926691.1 amidase family protein [Streptomyces sp. TRM 70351]